AESVVDQHPSPSTPLPSGERGVGISPLSPLGRGVGGEEKAKAGNLLVALQPNGSRTPCFMVHPPGGIVVCYRALAHRLGEDRPVYGIRSRGLHGETELPVSLEEMAAEYVAAIRAVQPHGPYHLGGWSMGGVVAYEIAQQLRKQGESLGLL